ncbi:MAG TPA: MFS transporter, partial [Clostridiaceae bacterium]
EYYFFLFIIFIFTLGNSTDALLLVKASDVGVSDAYIPIIYLVFNAVSVLFAVPAGMLSDKIGREKLIIFGYVIYSGIYFGFGMAGNPLSMTLLFALYGVYSAATDGVQKAMVSDIVDSDKIGTGLGLYNCILGVTLLPASVIAGFLYDNINNSAPFYYGAVLAMIAALLMVFYYMKRRKTFNVD